MTIDALNSKHIRAAAFVATETYSFSCTPSPVELWTTTAGATPSTTWNNRPNIVTKSDTLYAAYGYNSSCPSTPNNVSLDATAAVQAAADHNYNSIEFALVAGGAQSNLTWKKFAASTELVTTYESYPSTPAGRSAAPCWVQCGKPAIIRAHSTPGPTLTAESQMVESHPPAITYHYRVCPGRSPSPSGCQVVVQTMALGAMSKVEVPSGLTGSGDYEYMVQGCRNDDAAVCSDWTNWYLYTIDNEAPPAPSVTSSSFILLPPPTDGSTLTRQQLGHEFVPGTVTVGPNGGSDIYEYSYSPTQGSVASSEPACPSSTTDVWFKCAAGGGAVSFTAIPTLSRSNFVVAYAYDEAGNVSGPTTLTYDVAATAAAAPSHAWFDTASQVGDATVTDWPGAAGPVSLGTIDGTNVKWGTDAPPEYAGYQSLYFNGHGAVSSAATNQPTATLDAAHSFTVAAWVKPDMVSDGSYHTAVSQDGTNSAFYLQQTNTGYWRMCLPHSVTSTFALDCATYTAAQVDPTNWTLVVGEWDAPERKIVIYVGDSKHSANSSHTIVASEATGPISVGRATTSGAQTDWWRGGIADPLMYPDLLDASQITTLTSGGIADCITQGSCS